MQCLHNFSAGDDLSADAHSLPERQGLWVINAEAREQYDAPPDFIFAEQHRQWQTTLILLSIADGEFSSYGVADLIVFPETEFAQHISGEALILFPILREQCAPEDNINALFNRLADEHKANKLICDNVRTIVNELLAESALTGDNKGCLRIFAEHIRQHLAVENAFLLPIARVRMDDRSLKTMSTIIKLDRSEAAINKWKH